MLFWFDHIAVGGVVDDRFWQILIDVTWRDKLWFAWTFAPEQSTTKERWPQDAEDSGQCLSQQQSLQRKEEEDIRQCLKKYQCTDDCACIGPSIYCIRPSMHPCMHASSWQRASKQIDVCTKGYLDWHELNRIELLFFKIQFINFDEFRYGRVSTRDQSVAQFQDNFLYNFAG